MSGTGIASGSAGVAAIANAVNAINPVVWHKDKVGTEPGQEQELTLTFKKRDGNKIFVEYTFKSASVGRDDYYEGTRYNKVIITIGNTSIDFTYNSYNPSSSRQDLGKVTITGVAPFYGINNPATWVNIYYENKRLGPNEPFTSERTTGVQENTKIGALKIPANKLHTISFHKAYKNGKITNIPEDITRYKYSNIKIPSNILKDKANHYVFNQGYSTTTSGETTYIAKSDPRFMEYMRDAILLHWVPPDPIQAHGAVFFKPDDVNTKKPEKGLEIGDTLTIEENIDLYACWYPQTYTYKFFHSNSSNSKKYKNPDYGKKVPEYDGSNNLQYLTRFYKYGKKATVLPNFNDYTNNNDLTYKQAIVDDNDYYKIGYDFKGWCCNKDDEVRLKADIDSDTDFYPKWVPINGKVIFHFGFNKKNGSEKVKTESYTYDNNFNFNTLIKGSTVTSIRPGYKLIGWTTNKSEGYKIYKPGTGLSYAPYNYKDKYNEKIKIPTTKESYISNKQFKTPGLDLYAVWEYYTTVYVYDGGKWKAAIPYVYNKGKWKLTQAYGYTNLPNDQDPTWKR